MGWCPGMVISRLGGLVALGGLGWATLGVRWMQDGARLGYLGKEWGTGGDVWCLNGGY